MYARKYICTKQYTIIYDRLHLCMLPLADLSMLDTVIVILVNAG